MYGGSDRIMLIKSLGSRVFVGEIYLGITCDLKIKNKKSILEKKNIIAVVFMI